MECREREGPEAWGDLRPAGWDMERVHAFITEHWQTKVLSRAQREWGETQRRRLEKYVGPGHSGIILSALQAKECVCVLVRNRSLWQVLSKVMKRLSFAFRKFILVGSVEDEQKGPYVETGRPLKRWLGLPRTEIVKPEYGGKEWGDKGGSKKERLWDSRKWETLNAVKLS